jgi:hypothetical protein
MNGMANIRPDFMIIGAQKAGTSWLWGMLRQHPGTSLPQKKEIHFFGSAELFALGTEWYYSHFAGLDGTKVVGEASTTYFYDRVPYWHNKSNQIEFDDSLPPLPELITTELPDIKIIISLRDPVARAISAYHHWMRRGNTSPRLGLKKIATEIPKMRILEYGYYEKYLKVWKDYVPPERLHILVFEEDILENYENTLVLLYKFLDLSPDFKPKKPSKAVHKSWTWSRILFNYYAKRLSDRLASSRIASLFDRYDIFKGGGIRNEDVAFLRDHYLPMKNELENVLGRKLDCMKYGQQ